MNGRKAQLECGPILIAVKVYTAHETVKDGMKNTHTPCGSALNEKKWCAACEKEVLADEITKAYKLNSKTLVPLTDAELASLPVKSIDEIEFLQTFEGDIDSRYHGEHLYYIGPDGKAKAYQLLLTAIEKTKVKGLARFKKSLYVIEPFRGVLMMREVVYTDNLRGPEEIKLEIDQAMKKVAIGEKEQAAVGQLIGTMVQPLALESYTNAYTEALEKLVEAKIEGKVVTTTPTVEAKATSDDGLADAIMAYLNKRPTIQAGVGEAPTHYEVETVDQPAGEVVPLVLGATPEPVEAESEMVVLPW